MWLIVACFAVALALSIIINCALADQLARADRSNEELLKENNQLRVRISEMMTKGKVRVDLMEGWE